MRRSIPANERVAVTLRYLATGGDSYASLMYLFRIPKSTISKIVPQVCKGIYLALKVEYLKMPNTEEEWCEIAKDFASKWDFLNCLGALDGKHINIKAPSNSGSLYFNYKSFHSIILMALADATNYKFTYINIGSIGRNSDGGVFNSSKFAEALENKTLNIPTDKCLPRRGNPMPFVIVADDAFAMKSYLLKPYAFNNMNVEERIFNYRLSRARQIIENVFGITSARFRSLRKTFEIAPEKVTVITSAICVLHNFLITHCDRYAPPGTFDTELENGSIKPGSWRAEVDMEVLTPLQTTPSRNLPNTAKEIRNEFKDYIFHGKVQLAGSYNIFKSNRFQNLFPYILAT